jgi:hypothetical protein
MPIDWEELEYGEIKRIMWGFSDPDDLVTPLENLHEKLSSSRPQDIQFDSDYEIFLALLMMADGVLPSQAYKSLAKTFMRAFDEIARKKYTVDVLGINPPSRGRKSTSDRDQLICFLVGRLRSEGISICEAYRQVAEEYHLSEDTIRRIYERAKKGCLRRGLKALP